MGKSFHLSGLSFSFQDEDGHFCLTKEEIVGGQGSQPSDVLSLLMEEGEGLGSYELLELESAGCPEFLSPSEGTWRSCLCAGGIVTQSQL